MRELENKNLLLMYLLAGFSIDQLLYNANTKNKYGKLSNGIDETLSKNLKFIPLNGRKIKKNFKKALKKICCVLVEPIQGGFKNK